MPKRPGSLETLQLALELLRRIPKARWTTAAEIHQQLADADFARDLRTIQRQLDVLTDVFELDRDDSSKPYRYRWKPLAKGLSLPGLSSHESLLLLLAEEHLKCLLPSRLMKSMDGFFTQAHCQIDGREGTGRDRQWLEKVRVVSTSQPLLPPRIDPAVFEQVSDALYGNLWLEIDYKNAAGRRTSARVMPLGLAQQGPRLYLVARFEGYEDERSLALHRVLHTRATTLSFDRPRDFDLRKYDAEGRFSYGSGKLVRLSFRITKEAGQHLLESPLAKDQTIRDCPDAYEIAATVVDSDMLDWWLGGFGDAVSSIRKRDQSRN